MDQNHRMFRDDSITLPVPTGRTDAHVAELRAFGPLQAYPRNQPAYCVIRSNGDLVPESDELDLNRRAQRMRKARILAETRQLIARKGREGFVLKEVAERCEVSIQTIYNLVGDRSMVLATAVNEFIAASFSQAGRDRSYPNQFLALADMYWLTAVEQPDYLRNATLDYFSPHPEYRDQVRMTAIRLFNNALVGMKRTGDLRLSTNTEALASRFSCFAAAMVFHWAIGVRTLSELRHDLMESHTMLLRDALTPSAAERLEKWFAAKPS